MTIPQSKAGTGNANALNGTQNSWNLWEKILFRFFFVYLILETASSFWLGILPNLNFILRPVQYLLDWAVNLANAKLFHIRPVLIPLAGSGDTSYGWAQQCLFLLLATVGCLFWSVLDRKRQNYRGLNYWLCTIVRYSLAGIAFFYGIMKMFGFQMGFPEESFLATPLGDLLPMRFSWFFVGYSDAYQFFGGLLEVTVGALLMFRRTVTLGVMLATGVFINVMMLNLCYDIPVKIFSTNVVLFCLYLLANEAERIGRIFILNKTASTSTLYTFPYSRKWMRVTKTILKTIFILLAVVATLYSNGKYYLSMSKYSPKLVIPSGQYDVEKFARNKDTILYSPTDSIRWRDIIFEKTGRWGSIGTTDTVFTQWYRRGYFIFKVDTNQQMLNFNKLPLEGPRNDATILSLRYQFPDSNSIRLWGRQGNDSLFILLKKSNRHYQLAEKQFHWLSEYNR